MNRRAFSILWIASSVLLAPSAVASESATNADGIRSDLCKGKYFREHPVESVHFMGFFKSDALANAAARAIDVARFAVEVREAAVGGLWSLDAVYRGLPDADEYALDKERMRAIGKQYGADALTPGCRSFTHGPANATMSGSVQRGDRLRSLPTRVRSMPH
jgi:hypothetical protein